MHYDKQLILTWCNVLLIDKAQSFLLKYKSIDYLCVMYIHHGGQMTYRNYLHSTVTLTLLTQEDKYCTSVINLKLIYPK